MVDKREYEHIKTLKKLKLIDNDMRFSEEFLQEEVDVTLFNNVMMKLTKEKAVHHSNPITEEEFYLVGISSLGYKEGIDYQKDAIIDFAKKAGLCPIENKDYSNRDFINNVIDLLKSKTKEGIDYFEKLCILGVFSDYNEGKETPEILVFNGKTQPIFDYNKSIFEKVYVETPLDTDKDNKRDLIAVYIRRPLETNAGMKVPVIYVASPYMMGCNEDLYNLHNVDYDLEVFPETNIEYKDIQFKGKEMDLPEPRKVLGETRAFSVEEPEFDAITPWYKYFVTRGYAIVLAGGIGTLDSEGVRYCGSIEETISTISVIDWLNKRLRAFSNKEDNLEVVADWCNGNVGMTGKSYLGTLAVAAATTGVEGLKTVVPEAAISNWYEYYRCNGLPAPALGWQGDDADLLAEYCFSRMLDKDDYPSIKDYFDNVLGEIRKNQDRTSGNYNEFWDERNYLNNADKIKASVFIVHGIRDWNVKPKQFDMLWKELEKYDVPRKMIVHQGDHIYINNLAGIDFSGIMNKWYGYWLYGIENSIMEELPAVTIQNNVNHHKWDVSNSWPFNGVKEINFYVREDKTLSRIKDEYKDIVRFKDNISLMGFDRDMKDTTPWLNSLISEPQDDKPFRLSYLTNELEKDTRISGTVTFTMKGSIDSKTGIISAMLVDYGKENRPSLELKKVKENAVIYGINAGCDNLVDFAIDDNPSEFNVITRGWMSAQNRRNNYNKDEVVAGKDYEFAFEMQPIDYTIKKGHRLGLIIYSTDAEATPRPFKVTEFNIYRDSIVVTIPMK